MRQLVVGTGWKMNLGAAETLSYARSLREQLAPLALDTVDLFVLPPFTSLYAAREAFAGSPVSYGAQNMHWASAGAWTGEISASMLAEAGCRFVALGHAERIAQFGETYALVRRKVDAALAAGLTPIVCLGESAEARDSADATVASQLMTVVADRSPQDVTRLILAYEPLWAIGAPQAASADWVSARHAGLRAQLRDSFGDKTAQKVRILYGGSVTASNATELLKSIDVDGLFVGRAAWSATGFAEIVRIAVEARHPESKRRSA